KIDLHEGQCRRPSRCTMRQHKPVHEPEYEPRRESGPHAGRHTSHTPDREPEHDAEHESHGEPDNGPEHEVDPLALAPTREGVNRIERISGRTHGDISSLP